MTTLTWTRQMRQAAAACLIHLPACLMDGITGNAYSPGHRGHRGYLGRCGLQKNRSPRGRAGAKD
jgi:hypothetical protein